MNAPVSQLPSQPPNAAAAATGDASRASDGSAPAVVVYSTRYCGYCFRAEKLLEGKNVPFERVGVDDDWETRDWLVKFTGQRTVPQIVIHGRPIGGFTELAALERSGKLDQLLKAPRNG
jgi:glutaredoxin 3